MINVHIADYDCITALGRGTDALWGALMAGQCGFAKVSRFETGKFVNNLAACVGSLDAIEHGVRFPSLLETLCDKGFDHDDNTVLLTATTKDNIELLERRIRREPPCTCRLSACSMVETLADRLRIKRPAHNVNTACTSSAAAILWAAEMIRHRQADEVAVWAADLVSEFVFSGFSALRVMSPGAGRPFDVNRDGLILGEAAGYVVLMSEEKLLKQKKTSLGILRSWGISSDAHHITAPDRAGKGLQRAIVNALQTGAIAREHLAAICAHGTGTVHNDAMEIVAFNGIFGNAVPPAFSIKGAIGHCLGACGLIEIIVASQALSRQEVPPTAGMHHPEPEIADAIRTEPRVINGRYILSTNSGFGGSNTALVLEAA